MPLNLTVESATTKYAATTTGTMHGAETTTHLQSQFDKIYSSHRGNHHRGNRDSSSGNGYYDSNYVVVTSNATSAAEAAAANLSIVVHPEVSLR